jgi:PEP-CTERM motif-containing protein
MKPTRVLALTLLAVLVFGMSTSAMADTFTLSVTNGFVNPCPAWGCASVSVTIPGASSPNFGSQATITVTSLLNGYQFDNFGFNFTGNGSLSLKGSTGAVDPSDPQYGLSGPGTFQLNGFGTFAYLFGTGINGGSTGSNCVVSGTGVAGSGCTFAITLNGTGLTTTGLFESLSGGNAGDGNVFFAGHTAGSTCTGFVGGPATGNTQNGSSSCTSVPEPGSFMLFGVGLSALGSFVLRRKLRK